MEIWPKMAKWNGNLAKNGQMEWKFGQKWPNGMELQLVLQGL